MTCANMHISYRSSHHLKCSGLLVVIQKGKTEFSAEEVANWRGRCQRSYSHNSARVEDVSSELKGTVWESIELVG